MPGRDALDYIYLIKILKYVDIFTHKMSLTFDKIMVPQAAFTNSTKSKYC